MASRRDFLIGCSTAIAAMAGGKIGGLVFAAPGDTTPRDTLVVVFLRGGCDGLSLVAPTDDSYFQAARAGLWGDSDPNHPRFGGLLGNTLSGVPFRLHPKAAALKEIYDSGEMAIVHACGLNNGTRSHFDAMDYMERGTPNNKNTATGWMTRHLQSIDATGLLPAVAAGSTIPAALLGSADAAAMMGVKDFKINGHWKYGPQQQAILRNHYNGGTPLHQAGAETLDTVNAIKSKNPGTYVPETDADHPYPGDDYSGLTNAFKTVAQLIKMDVGLQMVTVDYGGWDTHDGQGYVFPGQVNTLSRALGAFYNDLSAYHGRLTVVVMSEFGRRLKANSNGGTDHGHGNVMLVLGGNVNGGRMFGRWPGLANMELDNGVDLAITTDYRTVLSEIVVRRLANPNLGQVFPQISAYSPLGIVRGSDLPIDYSSGDMTYLPFVRK